MAGVFFGPRVFIIEPVDIGEVHEHVGLDKQGNLRSERVVFPEPDFFGPNGVIFIDDGNGPAIEKAEKCITQV